ncbi:MAG TPA: DUF58 domain-containing protein [Thermoanaerobaculia bacterium]|nr:DUF58 domain-containing protein [Thermoanaerobaculia bacterium]
MTRLIPDWGVRVTNFGLGYILMCLVVAIAATNTGNNGLYLVLAGLLAGMAVSGMLSRRNVRSVRCEIEPLGEIVATRPSLLKVRLVNELRAGTAQALFFLHEALPGPLWIDPLAAGESREIVVEAVFRRRGVFREADSGLLSRFPLGLFRKYRRATVAGEIVVFPVPRESAVPDVPPEDARGRRPHPHRRGGGAEIRTLRDFVPGDDPRDLHWKQSARMRRWIVREREAERDRAVFLVVDNALADPGDPAALEQLEQAISHCAGQALMLLSRGAEVGFAARGVKVPPRAGRRQRAPILDALARLEPVPSNEAPAFPPMRKGDHRQVIT